MGTTVICVIYTQEKYPGVVAEDASSFSHPKYGGIKEFSNWRFSRFPFLTHTHKHTAFSFILLKISSEIYMYIKD